MKSAPFTITRLPSAGQYFVQDEDPAATAKEGDLWIDTAAGSVNVRRGGRWVKVELSGVALMDACITNRLLAADVNAGKITTGRLMSANGLFMLDLDTGEAVLENLNLGGKVQGNVVAESNDGKMRIVLVGKDKTKDVSAQIALEGRDSLTAEWTRKGLIWLGYTNHASACAMQNYEVGTGYVASRPTFAHNHSARDGILIKPFSRDYLRAAYGTYHGYRLVRRDIAYDSTNKRQYSFENIPEVNVAAGNVLSGETVECKGVCTQSYTLNEVAQIDFDLIITTAGTGNNSFGISRALMRQLNEEIPVIDPLPGGTVRAYSASGALLNDRGVTMQVVDGLWTPAAFDPSEDMQPVPEGLMTAGIRLSGTCYGRYTFEEDA
ncbi:MAG: hypothetical protein IJV14_15450 [Lachnospiraceae bacterium]|nr:hypothetical protein [Lachnospiraceae bacterium]